MEEVPVPDTTIMIIHPFDPMGNRVGGIPTFIRNFVKYAPENLSIELVGITREPKVKIGEWLDLDFNGRKLRFFPVLYVKDENVRPRVPLSLKFTLSLIRNKRKIPTRRRILDFHRIETSIPFTNDKIPKILFVHGNIRDIYNPQSEVKWSKFPILYFQLERELIRKFHKIYVVSKKGAEFYRCQYPLFGDRFAFLATLVDDEIFFPYSQSERKNKKKTIAQKFNFQHEESLIIFSGRLERPKDPMMMVEVFKRLADLRKRIKFLIVGTGSLEEEVKRKLQRYGLNKVSFIGPLNQYELAELLRVCDVFILTSVFEGMPTSVLEALACGVPVISTDVGEVKRVVKNGVSGFVCSSRNPVTISEMVERVLEGGIDRRQCVKSIEQYTPRHVLDPIYNLHKDIIHTDLEESNL